MSNFNFLKSEWPDLHEAAVKAEALAYSDARSACFYARRTLELAVHWLYKYDPALKLPYRENLSALIHEPTFRKAVGPMTFAKARLIKVEHNGLKLETSNQPPYQFSGGAAGFRNCSAVLWRQ